jgi:hypothetical protein
LNHRLAGIEWIQRDISDAELDMIMNRDLLFPHSHLSNVKGRSGSGTSKGALPSMASVVSLQSADLTVASSASDEKVITHFKKS